MKKILVTGARGQIGTELIKFLIEIYGINNVIASGIQENNIVHSDKFFLYEKVDVTIGNEILDAVNKHKVDSIIHLASILSATGELNPQLLWNVNMNGLYNVLEVARITGSSVFTPSSIAAFGPDTPFDNTPQITIQRPSTIYGISKASGELLCDYYFKKYGVDTRGIRFPGLISNVALPGGGTTDYAVHIFYEALKSKYFECNIKAGTFLDMMYMPDALESIVKLMEANPDKLINRNAFNTTAMSLDPESMKNEIMKHIPEFEMVYKIDPIRQKIADSWPNSLDASCARKEWGFSPKFNLASMTENMLLALSNKLSTEITY